MKQCWKRLAAAAIVFVMMLTMFPMQWAEPARAEETVTGTVTADDVFLRKQPGSSSYWFKLPKGFTCTVLGEATDDGVLWFKVNSAHPDSSTSNTYIGYIHSDFFTVGEPVDGDDEGDLDDSTPEGEEEGDGTAGGDPEGADPDDGDDDDETITVGEVNADDVNFRKTPGGKQIARLKKGTRVEILEKPEGTTAEYWYKVAYDGDTGYIQAPFITVLGTTTGDVNNFGYVRLVKNSANLRAAPGGKILAQWETPGEVIPVTGPTKSYGGYTWYPVLYKGSYYFVRNDCVQPVTDGGSGSGNEDPEPVLKGYLKTTKSGVNLRQEPGGKVIDQIAKGVVVKRMSDEIPADGYKWYLVEVDGVRGYMRSDCVTHVNSGGDVTTPPTETEPPTDDDDDDGEYGYVITIKSGVNVRATPAGTSKEQVAKGVVLPLTGAVVNNGSKYQWYPVRTEKGTKGYVRSDCVKPCTSDGSATTPPTEGDEDPAVTTPPSTSGYGYVMITSNSVNVRKTPGGDILGQVKKNTVWPMTANSTDYDGYTWYPINADGLKGYVRGDHSFKLSPAQEESYIAGNGVPKDDGTASVTKYVQTIKDDVYLRVSASKDAEHLFQVDMGTVMAFDMYKTVGGKVWYRVIYSNKQVWVRGDCVKVMTDDEYNDYIEANPESTPQTQIILGYVKTTTDNVNVRKAPGSSDKLGKLAKDTVVPYSAVETAKNYTWYLAQTSVGKGYLRDDVVTICDENGDAITSGGGSGSGSGTGEEASYTTLKRGSKGTAVKNLVTELKKQGYYSGEITSSYTIAVENAVKAFQAANGLEVDGIAGEKTQHKLFGTVPVGSGSGNLSFTIYPAEKVDWYKGDIQQLWPKGSSYKVFDVKTGIVWWARRWSGAYHADVEPLTAADSARLCKIYGTKTTQEIWDKNMWHRRPSLVTIGSRTIACSLYGMPHNEDGDTIPDNDMTGQICIHFTNSKIHGSGKVDEDHQAAIEEAYQYAKNGDPR